MSGKESEPTSATSGASVQQPAVLGSTDLVELQRQLPVPRHRMLGMTTALTEVELVFYEKRIEHWLRFGNQSRERIFDRRRRVIIFTPGDVFGFVRWEGNDYGTVSSRFDIVRASAPGEPITSVPGIDPGGDVLLRLDGWQRVKRALDAIAGIEGLGIDPALVAPDWWRHLHNRIVCTAPFRPYGRTQHRAWLLRRRAVT